MRVLSLFDGISAGQESLWRLGVKIDKYYASEVDDKVIWVTQKNYPNTIQLGDVKNWRAWNIDLSKIDILFGGYPCQNYSMAGKQTGTEGESGSLVYYLAEIFAECKRLNPNLIFLFENVKMKKTFLQEVNEIIGVSPTLIDSALVSAQSRKRYYWTNLGENIPQPIDKGIKLKDILESGVVDRDKSYCLTATYCKGGNLGRYCEKSQRQLVFEPLSTFGQGQRVYSVEGKSITLSAQGGGQGAKTGLYKIDLPDGEYYIRKLTAVECEKLQNFPPCYTEGISNTQRLKALGNSWTVDVIVHILKNILKGA